MTGRKARSTQAEGRPARCSRHSRCASCQSDDSTMNIEAAGLPMP